MFLLLRTVAASLRLIIDLFFLMIKRKYMKRKVFSFSSLKNLSEEIYIVNRTRSYNRQLSIVSNIHFPFPINSIWIVFWGLTLHLYSLWNLGRPDSTSWLQEWPCDLVLASKSTAFWPWEFRSIPVSWAEAVRHSALH